MYMYRVKETHFKMHLIYVGCLLHDMDVNRYYGTHFKIIPISYFIIYKLINTNDISIG